MQRHELVNWLDNYLNISAYKDKSLNGLQVEGAAEVKKIALAVDSSMKTFEQAAEIGADMLIVHHGLFWGKPLAITGMHATRVRFLLDKNISLYAAHLPLDAHEEVGNNWGLARLMGMADLQPFGKMDGNYIGVKGTFPNKISLRELAELIEHTLSAVIGGHQAEPLMVHSGGAVEVESLAMVSGGSAFSLIDAAEQGMDAFLTGEPRHEVFHDAFERGINALYAGHYMTETVGVNLLGAKIRELYGIPNEFILLTTGL